MSDMPAGLRERKKQQTRDAICRAAMGLFAERGFEATTIADIAAAADISPRTFFSYFGSKEEVVFADFDAALDHFDRAMRERPPGTTAIEALRDWLKHAVEQFAGDPEREQLEARLVREAPAVAACELQNMRRFELRLADAVAQDLGKPPDALPPRMVAAAAIAAMQATKDAISPTIERDREATAAMLADPMAILDDTLRFLEGGLAALRG